MLILHQLLDTMVHMIWICPYPWPPYWLIIESYFHVDSNVAIINIWHSISTQNLQDRVRNRRKGSSVYVSFSIGSIILYLISYLVLDPLQSRYWSQDMKKGKKKTEMCDGEVRSCSISISTELMFLNSCESWTVSHSITRRAK